MDADADIDPDLVTKMGTEIEEYVHSMRRYLKLQGVEVQQFKSEVADPSKTFEVQINMVSATTRIPKRILMGSERGELASSQDAKHYNQTIDERRDDVATPSIVRPFIEKMQVIGELPTLTQPFAVIYPDLEEADAEKQANIAAARTKATKDYADSNAEAIVDRRTFLKEVWGMEDEEIDAMNDRQIEEFVEEEAVEPVVPAAKEEVTE